MKREVGGGVEGGKEAEEREQKIRGEGNFHVGLLTAPVKNLIVVAQCQNYRALSMNYTNLGSRTEIHRACIDGKHFLELELCTLNIFIFFADLRWFPAIT
jgi:hypothetical protein